MSTTNTEAKELAFMTNDRAKIMWYQFADKLNPHEARVLLQAKGNEYWQFKYLVNNLKVRKWQK